MLQCILCCLRPLSVLSIQLISYFHVLAMKMTVKGVFCKRLPGQKLRSFKIVFDRINYKEPHTMDLLVPSCVLQSQKKY